MPSSTVMLFGCARTGGRLVPVTVMVKFFVFVNAGLPDEAVTEAEYGEPAASPKFGAMWMLPFTVPAAGTDVSVAKLGRMADNVITSPSTSVALTATSAVAPSATV